MSKKRIARSAKYPGGRGAKYPDDGQAIRDAVLECAQSLGFRATVRSKDHRWELQLNSPFGAPGKWQRISVTWDEHFGALVAQSSRLISKDYAEMLYQRSDQEELAYDLHQFVSRHPLVDFGVEIVPIFKRGKVTPPKGIIIQSRFYTDGDEFTVSRSELFDVLSRVEQARREVDSILWRFRAKGQATPQDEDIVVDRDPDKLTKIWDALPAEGDLRNLTRLTIPPFGPLAKVAVLMAFDSWIAGVSTEDTKARLLREAESLASDFLEDADFEVAVDLMSDFVDATIEEIQRLQPSITYADAPRPTGQLTKLLVQEAIRHLIRNFFENPPF